MEAAEVANALIQKRYTKDRKIGEGTYAVVYIGALSPCVLLAAGEEFEGSDTKFEQVKN